MVDKKTFVASIVVLLYVFRQHAIRAQSNFGFSSEDEFCSQIEEKWKIQVVENIRLQCALYSQLQTVENHRLKFELEKKQLKIEKLENESVSQVDENHRLNFELEKKQLKIETLKNVSYTQAEEIHRLSLELEKKQLTIETIETLENESISQADESHRLEEKQLKIKALENESISQSEENQRLKLENERHRLKTQPVTATLIHRLEPGLNRGITKVDDRIYVLSGLDRFKVYEDGKGFSLISEIMLNNTSPFDDIVYSNKSKCIYMKDFMGSIWVMTTTDVHRVTMWLPNITGPNSPSAISLSNEGHLLVLRTDDSFNLLEIYSLNATVIRRLHLPQDFKAAAHFVQTSTGNFIIGHQLNRASSGPWVISKLTNDGQLIQRFIPKKQLENSFFPVYLCLDSENNRLFVADHLNKRVVLFDSTALTWIQVLVSSEMDGISYPGRLFYDASKKHLVIASTDDVSVYEIS